MLTCITPKSNTEYGRIHYKEDKFMKAIHKRVLVTMLALVMLFSCTSIALAAEIPEDTAQYAAVQESSVSPRAVGMVYEYKNSSFKDSAAVYFTSPISGKAGLLLSAATIDGSTGTKVTARLYVKNALGTYSEIVSYTVDANGKATTKYSDVQLYAGEKCMLTITANTSKTLVLVCRARTR